MSRIEQGKALMKEGDTLLKGGFFTKSDPEKAVKKYEEGMKKFRGVIPMTDQSLQLLLKACNKTGNLNNKLRYYTKAAKSFEEGAKVLMKKELDPEQACQLFQLASGSCRMATNFDQCGKMMLKAAEASQQSETKIQLAIQSCDIMIEEERMGTSRDHFQKAVNIIMKEGAYGEAIGLLLKQVEAINALSQSQNNTTLYQSMLSIICIYLFQKNREQAHDASNQFCSTSQFGESEQYGFASKLIKAFADCDEQILDSLRSDFGIYLVGEPSRLIRKMNFHGLEPIDLNAYLDDMGEEEVEAKMGDDGMPDFM